ncbi:hypothetical protein THAOC_34113 [Thalassiosira oceanica]|uniref:Uncharacterized protein n=1 Tax=Thalassiosira oceanica TaxID=159749 RepID=K0RDV2_THAOC|nr:hypothetical protein THAOC_34113 [Thalassiosira oceanica]|eukprot:EJK47186.1 hypothetical protein THAOC_34113 [Thalassiosira oceanica]
MQEEALHLDPANRALVEGGREGIEEVLSVDGKSLLVHADGLADCHQQPLRRERFTPSPRPASSLPRRPEPTQQNCSSSPPQRPEPTQNGAAAAKAKQRCSMAGFIYDKKGKKRQVPHGPVAWPWGLGRGILVLVAAVMGQVNNVMARLGQFWVIVSNSALDGHAHGGGEPTYRFCEAVKMLLALAPDDVATTGTEASAARHLSDCANNVLFGQVRAAMPSGRAGV